MKLAGDKPSWVGSQAGRENKVLWPWTPMGVAGKTICCWGREHTLADVGLPAQIVSAGLPLLSEPIRWKVRAGGGAQTLKGDYRITSESPTCVRWKGTASSKNLDVATRGEMEFDGMMRLDVVLRPRGDSRFTSLVLEIPLRAQNARLYHLYPPLGDPKEMLDAGGIDAESWELPFVNYLWVGNEERGLCWFAESRQYFSLDESKPAIEILRKGDTGLWRIHVINKPCNISEPIPLTFGLQATPVKPWLKESSRWTFGHLGSDANVLVMWAKPDTMKYHAHPDPLHPGKFRALVKSLHKEDKKIMVYAQFRGLNTGVPESKTYAQKWSARSGFGRCGDVVAMGHQNEWMCLRQEEWHDFAAEALRRYYENYDVDGIYYDHGTTCVFPCMNIEHPDCYYLGDRPKPGRPQYPQTIFDARRLAKRLYAITKEGRPDRIFVSHCSARVIAPVLSFCDICVDGEQCQSHSGGFTVPCDGHYMSYFPLEYFRAEFMGRPLGIPDFFLPENLGGEGDAKLPENRELLAILLLHDTRIWLNGHKVQFEAYKALDDFGIIDSEFVPYWPSPESEGRWPRTFRAVTGGTSIKVSGYVHPGGRALLIVGNLGHKQAKCRVRLNRKRLGFEGAWTATEPMLGQEFAVKDSELVVRVPGRDFRIVRVEQK